MSLSSAKSVATCLCSCCTAAVHNHSAILYSKLHKLWYGWHCDLMFGNTCRATGFTVPLAHGRGFFYGPVGLLPFRESINVVVGGPLQVEQYNGTSSVTLLACSNDTYWLAVCWYQSTCQVTMSLCTGDIKSEEAVQLGSKYHQEYIQKLQALYDAHKDVFFSDRVSDMRLVM